MQPITESTKCKFCNNEIKNTRFNRIFCNDYCRIKHHLKMKGKRVMLLSKEEYELIVEMRKKSGENIEPRSNRKALKPVKTGDQQMNELIDYPSPVSSNDSRIEMEI